MSDRYNEKNIEENRKNDIAKKRTGCTDSHGRRAENGSGMQIKEIGYAARINLEQASPVCASRCRNCDSGTAFQRF